MSGEPRVTQLQLAGSFANELADDLVVAAFGVGPSGDALVLAVAKADAAVPFAVETQPGWATFPKDRADRVYDAVLLAHDGSRTSRTNLHAIDATFPRIQSLPGPEFLVVGARSRRDKKGARANASVYGSDGSLKRAFVLGDGIEDVQATVDGKIWVSYGDEGVYGNFGWGAPGGPSPIGSAGLVRFDSRGNLEWEYAAPPGLDRIDDCYALNVAADATWAYYYSSFPLVRIAHDGAVSAWKTRSDATASALAVAQGRVVFFGGYAGESDLCQICEFKEDAVVAIDSLRLVLPNGGTFDKVIGRGSMLHVRSGHLWYRLDVGET